VSSVRGTLCAGQEAVAPTDAGACNTRSTVLTIPCARHYKCKPDWLGAFTAP
jgi:hypothetical protein